MARYSYEWIRGKWNVYDNERNLPVECFFDDKESARKRVYELNGWNYSPKK